MALKEYRQCRIYSGAPFAEGGITVQYVGSLPGGGIWDSYTSSIGGQGSYGWYPNFGGYGYTEITLTGGGDFQDIQLLVGTGGVGRYTQYQLLNNGVVVAGGYVGNPGQPMGNLGFSGGGFDEVLLQTLENSDVLFNPTGLEDLAIDSIAANPVAVPGPIAGAGLPRPDLRERWPARLVAQGAVRFSRTYLVGSALAARRRELRPPSS
jgi:hypothetical protein